MTKEEPLIRQLVRTRALNSRDGSLSPTRRGSADPILQRGQPSRSMSQPPRPRPDPTPVFTPLYILPYSLVYPPTTKTPKVSFCSVSQPDLTKLVCTTVTTSSLCSTPLSMNLSRCGSPAPPILPSPFSTPPATPPLLSNQNWSLFASSQDLNINSGAGANAGANTGAGVFASSSSLRAKRGNYKASEASLENCFKSFKIGRRGIVGVTNNCWQQLDHLHSSSFFFLYCTEMKVVAGFHFHPSAEEGRPSFSFSFRPICA